jgi:CHAT domain-containing protein/tetratricopeptide (TPR) repeat protein
MQTSSRWVVAAAVSLGFTALASPRAQSGTQTAAVQNPAVPNPSDRVMAMVALAEERRIALRLDDAVTIIEEAIAEAERTGDRFGLAKTHREKGSILQSMGRTPDALIWIERALAEYEAIGDRAGIASSLSGLLSVAVPGSDRARTAGYGARALQLYSELGDERGRAIVLLNLARQDETSAVANGRLTEVLAIADRLGSFELRGSALKIRGGRQFTSGDLAAAQATLESAIAAFERAPDVEDRASTYLMLGRVYRAHGDFEDAIRHYQRAIDILAPTRERFALVEAVNAKAVALGYLERNDEAIATYEHGLALARESGNPRLIDFMLGNLAGGLVGAKDYARALPILQEVLARKPEPYIAAFRYDQLAVSLANLGRASEAMAPMDESMRISRELKQTDSMDSRLDDRAMILARLGRYTEAVADVREALAVVDQVRTRLIPQDYLKRGYGDRVQQFYARGVDILSRLGRGPEALEMAEQGRARAFLDLLAARESADPALATRGAAAAAMPSGAALGSASTGRTLSVAEIAATAARLHSTILTYWVGDDATTVWVIGPDGRERDLRLPIGRNRLATLVAATTAPLRESGGSVSTRGADEMLTALPLRGLGLLALTRDDRSSWRELYKSLIEPIRSSLPARGGQVTIVPHGPLFQLSFAALQSPAGRYLVEDYVLNYAPAISVLDFTSRRQVVVASNTAAPWVVIGNPSALPAVGKTPLSPLPGAAREIASIAAIAPRGDVTRLEGGSADESALFRALDAKHPSVLHFATHGFVFDDPKQPPFLALQRTGDSPGVDGRLTLDEVYGLSLSTDLVVLSACRTGFGQVSSDGIVGLTRGFFYAGAPSVMATFWDVTDETTAILMPGFYRNYVRAKGKSASLRSAQLALLADLRAGRVVVMASGRRVTLPEHPLLWAAFFLSGEP